MTDLFATPGVAASPPISTGQSLILDALCIHQSPANVQQLVDLLSTQHTTRGGQFNPPEVRRHLVALQALARVSVDPRGLWSAEPGAAWPRFVALMQDPGRRSAWWQAWRLAKSFDQNWRSLVLDDEAMADALRMVVYAGGTVQALERLERVCYGVSPEQPRLLARALLMPFERLLWERIEPELQLRLLTGLMQLTGGDCESVSAPLWTWLLAQSRPRPEAMHDLQRLNLAQRMVFADQADETRRLLHGMDHAVAQAVLATTDIAAGRYAEGAAGFEAAAKRRGSDTGRRKGLFSDHSAWCYLLALVAQPDPAAWTKARKFAAAEAGKRDADPYSFFGIWQTAIDQRLGDAPRSLRPFHLTLPSGLRPHGLWQLANLLLAAWLGLKSSGNTALAEHARALSDAYERGGLAWLALLVRRSAALLLDVPALPADAAKPFAVGASEDRWREALSAIVALGDTGPSGATAGAAAQADRLVWLLQANPQGRVRSIEPMLQSSGARGLGKAKKVALTTLMKRIDLPGHDAAVLRAVKKMPFGTGVQLDRNRALLSLVRHPCVAWADAPAQFIDISEGLPQLEVLTRGEHLQFRVVDPIRPQDNAAETADDDDDDDFDDDESDGSGVSYNAFHYRRTPVATPQVPPLLLLRDGPERARLLRITPAQLRVAELVSQGWQVPTAARTELEAALKVLGSHFSLASDAEAGSEVPPAGQLRAELTPQGQGLSLRLVAAPFGDFGPRTGPGLGRERVTTVHQGLTLSTRRDLALERAQMRALTDDLVDLDETEHAWTLDEPEQALAVVEVLARHSQAIISEWPKGRAMRISKVSAANVSLSVASRGDWLEIDGQMTADDGQVLQLRQLLELMRGSRSRYVALGDGGFVALTDTLRQQLADLRAITQDHGKVQRLASIAALAWAAQDGAPELGGDGAWQDRCAAWDRAQAASFSLPAGLLAELRDYQASGWHWLMRLAASGFGAVLADDMGLGKTLQTLGLLVARAAGGPALVVAPTSVCGNWLEEAGRFAPGLRFSQYGLALGGHTDGADDADDADNGLDSAGAAEAAEGSDAEVADDSDARADAAAEASPLSSARKAARRRQVQALGAGDVLVCSYGLLQLDGEILASRRWHSAVLDEAQAIKNAATRRARAAYALAADFRLALTGTPVENRLGELWSIFAFANPGLLGSAEQFGQRFAGPIERDADAQASRRLRRLIAPFLLRRTKTEVLSDLPPRTEIVHSVVPGSRERALLEALRQQAEESVNQAIAGDAAAGPGQSQMHILAALTRLRRAACDPRLVAPELGIVGAKVQEFERLAQELVAGRHKALVFSQFTDFLALLRERLDGAGLSYQYLDGSTPAAQRSQRVAAFQAGQGDFFLISLKAGGFGLNLTMADYVIIADPWWNPAAEDQASGRAHRIGQQRPVTVYRLVTQGSIEDRIVKLHGSKRALAEGVLAGQDGAALVMDAGQMLALLRGQDEG